MKVNREKFLQQLHLVEPGLSSDDIIEQSGCFVFRDGTIQTFNDEVACTIETDVKFTGAVTAKPLLELLQKLQDDTIEVSIDEREIRIKGERREAGIRMEQEILLPVDAIEKPKGKWSKLDGAFCEALGVVKDCVSSNENAFALTCIHITDKYVEACDGYQVARFVLKTNFKNDALLKRDPAVFIANSDVVEFNEGDNWIHFRNSEGLVISCRKYVEEFPDLDKFLKVKGESITLPDGLAEAVEKAGIFSAESGDDNIVVVSLSKGRLVVKGEGLSGWYKETKRMNYKGKAIEFGIPPALLKEIAKRHKECELTETNLKASSGNFVYLTCLDSIGDEPEGDE